MNKFLCSPKLNLDIDDDAVVCIYVNSEDEDYDLSGITPLVQQYVDKLGNFLRGVE